ncbi:MAG: succinylglutamate desuccinylase/aspartoacylase family protein [Balneolaceae bacterium]|nr:succinylglutamate desuccinylase/aspartoacylase family protein [Balneolaceae bacterium]
MVINKEAIALGEHRELHLTVARLPTHTPIDLPVHVYRGEQEGPVLLLTGGLHGDEINGIEIIRRMISRGQLHLRRGAVIAIPLVNLYGFIQNVRGLPDGKDINRSFPGAKGGSLARLLAHTLMNQILPRADYGIDFHTGGASRANFPQVRSVLDVPENAELARAFAPPVILHSSLIDKSFRKAAHKKGKHILVYETGESHRLDEEGIRLGIEGTLRVMKHLEMRESAPEAGETQIYRKSTWVRARYAGLFRSRVAAGDTVRHRQVVGHINDPYGTEQYKVSAPRSGRVIGLNHAPVVHKGDALMHLAYNE